MSVWSSGILTKKGLNLHAKVEAGTTLLKVTKMAVGSGVLEDDEDTQDVTALKHEELKVDISMAKAQDNGLCVITGILTNENVNVGFYAKEMALFAEDPDEGEILYQYASDSKPDWVPAITETKAPINIQLDTNVAISNAELINVEISPAGIVSIEVLNHYLNEHNEDNTAHTNLFKTLFNITTVNATKIKDKIKEYAGEKISEVFGVATVTKDTIKNQVKTYTKEVIKELLGITETTTEKIKAKILEWVQEQINTWLESQGIRYNIAQNGYICLGHFFGDAIIQWGTNSITVTKDFTYADINLPNASVKPLNLFMGI
nr:MAG: tail-collar fiber protein [Bacteriophage sp.]